MLIRIILLEYESSESSEIMTVNYFCVRHENMWKHNQNFELLFFMINLHFTHKTNYLHIEKQLYFPKTVFMWSYFLWKFKEESYTPGILHFFQFAWKEMTHKLSREATAKVFFSPVCILLLHLAPINVFLFHVINQRHCFLWKSIDTLMSLQPPCSCTLWSKWFGRSSYFILKSPQ